MAANQRRNEELIASLNQWRVPFLSTQTPAPVTPSLPAEDLIEGLIRSDSARLKLGVTAFFIVHSDQAPVVLTSVAHLDEKDVLFLKYYYMAALYLQRFWLRQFSHFGNGLLPDYFSKELSLPEPTRLHGRLGLHFLEAAMQRAASQPYDYYSPFQSLARLLQDAGRAE